MEPARRADAFDAIPAFRNLRPAARAALAGVCREANFRSEERVIPLLHARQRIHFLLDGIAKLSAVSPSGVERILYVYRPGDILGSRFLLESPENGHEVVAMTSLRALAAEKGDFLEVCDREPEILFAVTRDFTGRLERMTERFLGAVTTEAPVRLAGLLLDFVAEGPKDEAGFIPLTYPLTHKTLAQIVGASRPHVSAILGQLEAAGAVRRLKPRGLAVCPAVLRRIVRAGEFEPPS